MLSPKIKLRHFVLQRSIRQKLDEIRYLFANLFRIPRVVTQKTLWPECKAKSKLRMWYENIVWLLRHNELNVHYKNYGMDIINLRMINEYLSHYEFIKCRRNQLERSEKQQRCSYSALLTDKYVFSKYFSSVLGPECVTQVVALVIRNTAILERGLEMGFDEYLKTLTSKVMYKPINQASARDVCSLEYKNDHLLVDGQRMSISEFRKTRRYQRAVIEYYIVQHRLLAEINPDSVNTLRIITIIGDNEFGDSTPLEQVRVFSSYLRAAAVKGVSADNMSRGGVFVGIQDDGALRDEGYCVERHLDLYGRYSQHPITAFKFAGFRVPYWVAAVDLVKRAHKHIWNVKSIGWDVAITESGPIIIEGNIAWAFPHQQIANGPLKERWYKFFDSE